VSERRTFTWRGVDHSGQARTGEASMHLSAVAAQIERYYRAGWRSLTVEADGYQKVGAIEKIDGKRVWWAATDTPCAFCGRFRGPQIGRYDRWFCDEICVRGYERNRRSK
jgi:hypothetical protein